MIKNQEIMYDLANIRHQQAHEYDCGVAKDDKNNPNIMLMNDLGGLLMCEDSN